MYEVLAEIEYEGDYQVPISPFVTSILFAPLWWVAENFQSLRWGPITAKFENCCDRLMMLHDACTSETSRVLKIVSLQQLKMETLISAPAGCEV